MSNNNNNSENKKGGDESTIMLEFSKLPKFQDGNKVDVKDLKTSLSSNLISQS